MTAQLLDGKNLANKIATELREIVVKMRNIGKNTPELAVILVGDNPASLIYIAKKRDLCQQIGIIARDFHLAEETSETSLLQLIDQLNHDPRISGILVQLPLPSQISTARAIEAIDPAKDVDGFHPQNIGKLANALPTLHPCTPCGIMEILKAAKISLSGKHAVVVGASYIVGRPLALELLNTNATVTICHKFTQKLHKITRTADLLISATGVPGLITADYVQPGAVIIDVGITRLNTGQIVGDVVFDEVKELASWITPVPGGVGPMTVAMLMKNTLVAAGYL